MIIHEMHPAGQTATITLDLDELREITGFYEDGDVEPSMLDLLYKLEDLRREAMAKDILHHLGSNPDGLTTAELRDLIGFEPEYSGDSTLRTLMARLKREGIVEKVAGSMRWKVTDKQPDHTTKGEP